MFIQKPRWFLLQARAGLLSENSNQRMAACGTYSFRQQDSRKIVRRGGEPEFVDLRRPVAGKRFQD